MSIIVKTIKVGQLETNCYIASCEFTGSTFIIDPGDNPKAIVNYIYRNEFIPKAIILTHGHPDHTGAAKILRGELGVPVYMHRADLEMLKMAGLETVDKFLFQRNNIDLGREKFTVIHTPGHTPGGICILGNGILFSGDTLFHGGVGRTDLMGGSSEELENSIRNKLFILPPETLVYPGHGPETTIGNESIS